MPYFLRTTHFSQKPCRAVPFFYINNLNFDASYEKYILKNSIISL